MIEEPFKIVGQLLMLVKDDEGRIVGERVAGNVAIYATQFDRVPELVDDALRRGESPPGA